jgi:hypothetical protein
MPATPNVTYIAATEKALQEGQAHLRPYEERERAARPRPQGALTPEQQAAALRHMPYIADALAGLGATPGGDDVPGGRPGLCEPLREAGSLPDPLKRMLAQKLIVASHSVARMLARAARSQRPEEAEAALEAAARFTEVLRRGALALKRYRGGRRRRRGD